MSDEQPGGQFSDDALIEASQHRWADWVNLGRYKQEGMCNICPHTDIVDGHDKNEVGGAVRLLRHQLAIAADFDLKGSGSEAPHE